MTSWIYSDPEKRSEILSAENLPIDKVTKSFLEWCHVPDRSILYNTGTEKFLPVTDLKLGNAKYAAKQNALISRVSEALEKYPLDFEIEDKDPLRFRRTCGLFFTLEFPPDLFDVTASWEASSPALQRFKAHLRKIITRYLGSSCEYFSVKVCEAHRDGRCHIHMFIVLDNPLPVFLKGSYRKGKPTGNSFWRLSDRSLVEELRMAWCLAVHRTYCELAELSCGRQQDLPRDYAFFDCQGVVQGEIRGSDSESTDKSTSNVVYYILKYLSKPLSKKDTKAATSLALSKLFGRRTIFSRKFMQQIGLGEDIIRHDILQNELKLLQQEWTQEKDSWGDLDGRGAPPDRFIRYAEWIKAGFVPYDAVIRRRSERLPFRFYERYRPTEADWLKKMKPNPWIYMGHFRYASSEIAKLNDEIIRNYDCDTIPYDFSETAKDRLKYIILTEGLEESSSDYFLILN